ncbi:MAG: RHS repeat-associated core domain-containing protein, partial [Tepidisphaeraceae bacterium]
AHASVAAAEAASAGLTTTFTHLGGRIGVMMNEAYTHYRGGATFELVGHTTDDSGVRWYLGDHQNSVRQIVADGGQRVAKVDYDAFGNVTAETPAGADTGAGMNVPPRFGYTGQERDAGTGLVYMGGRYYDPASGTMLSPDLPVEAGGDINGHRYVYNMPVNLVDNDGWNPFGGTGFGAIRGYTTGGLIGAAVGAVSSAFAGSNFGQALANHWGLTRAAGNADLNDPSMVLANPAAGPGAGWSLVGDYGRSGGQRRVAAQQLASGNYAMYAPVAWHHAETGEYRWAGHAFAGAILSQAQLGDAATVARYQSNFLQSLADDRRGADLAAAVGHTENIISYLPTGNAQIHASRGRLGQAAIALGIDAASLVAGGAAGRFAGSLIGRTGATMASRIGIGAATGAVSGGVGGFVQGGGQTYLNTGDVGQSMRMGSSLSATGAVLGGVVGGVISAPYRPGTMNGARIQNLEAWQRASIQRFADQHGVEVRVFGSRARGTAGPQSDFDYIVSGNRSTRLKATHALPRGTAGGVVSPRGQTGMDVFKPSDIPPHFNIAKQPQIIFTPRGGGQ